MQQNATINEWCNNHYREYTRVRYELYELRERCREICSKNWENNVTDLLTVVRIAKTKLEGIQSTER